MQVSASGPATTSYSSLYVMEMELKAQRIRQADEADAAAIAESTESPVAQGYLPDSEGSTAAGLSDACATSHDHDQFAGTQGGSNYLCAERFGLVNAIPEHAPAGTPSLWGPPVHDLPDTTPQDEEQ